jgi:hypothetical protein
MDHSQILSAVRRYKAQAARGIHNGLCLGGDPVTGITVQGGRDGAFTVVHLDSQQGAFVFPGDEIVMFS